MTITEYPHDLHFLDFHDVNIGRLYFFENFVITEFNEGVDIDHDTFAECTTLIKNMYGNRPFGYLANRINCYSINLSHTERFNNDFPNVVAYAVVSDRLYSSGIFEIENLFFKANRQMFKTLDDGITWVTEAMSAITV